MLKLFSLSLKWVKTWKTLPVFSWLKASLHYRREEFCEAERLYRQGLERNASHPANLCARMDLSYCLFKNGKYKEAEENLRYVINSSPSTKEAYLRLARLQIWMGKPLEACWIMRRALRQLGPDTEIVATYLLAVLENDGPAFLMQEAMAAYGKLSLEQKSDPKLEVAMARFAIRRGEAVKGRESIARLASEGETSFEAVVAFADVLLSENRIAHARQQLKRAMLVAPNHPRVLGLLARSYLIEGAFLNADYGVQLALQACQHSAWSSPREMQILAQAYTAIGDKSNALLIAHKARDVGSKLLGYYQDVKKLDKLIETLSA